MKRYEADEFDEELPLQHEAVDWDEEDLGIAWDETEAQRIAELLTRRRTLQ